MTDFKLSGQSRIVILVAVLASLLEIVDTSIVNVAIPTMMGNLGATIDEISWIVTGYIIANAIVLPIAGWLGMRIGRRKYYVGAILLFTATSVACGIAPNLATLVVFRIIQGLAGGALLPTSQALIQEQFPREKAGMANAIFGMSVMVGPTVGPTLGGYLTDQFGWRSIFNINLPLGLLAAALAYGYITDKPQRRPGEKEAPVMPSPSAVPAIDSVGLALLVAGVGCLQYVLERGQADDWFSSSAIVVCTLIAVIAIPFFIWWELRTPHPIVNLRLFRISIVRNGALLMMGLGLALYGLVFILPIFVGRMLHFNATQTGELFIPGALLTAFSMPFVGALLRKVDPRWLILYGILTLEAALVMMTGFNSQTGGDDLFWALFVRGAAMAFLFVPINTVVLGQFSGGELGQVAGLMNLFRQIGGSMGIAGLSTLLDRNTHQNYLDLASRMSLLDPATWQAYQATTQSMLGKMGGDVGFAASTQATLRLLRSRLETQVFALSFQQMMWLLVIGFGLALIPLALLRPAKRFSGPVDAH